MELVKQVLADRTDLFQKDYLNPRLEIILGTGVIFANGDDWKRHRKVVHPVFNQEKLKVNSLSVDFILLYCFSRCVLYIYADALHTCTKVL